MMTSLTLRFHRTVPALLQIWDQCEHKTPIYRKYSLKQQTNNEKRLETYIKKSEQFLNHYQLLSNHKWRQAGNKLFQEIIRSDALCITTGMTPTVKRSLCEVSKQFLRDALAFDEELSLQDIGQALRNVWICIVLQMVFKKEISYHRAIFGYSMLYPYTDNVLDDPTLTEEEKAAFNERFYQRLRGQMMAANTKHEEHVFALIACIEQVYERNRYPDVYESLYLIMEGQIKSLTQQNTSLTPSEISKISAEKGAASVVADGYMVCGSLDDQALSFCMQYGFMLQLGDDLQDMIEDMQNYHRTMFSIPLPKADIEKQVKQLLVFTQQLLENYPCEQQTKRLIIENCELLVYLSVISQPQYYDILFLSHCHEAMPIREVYIREQSQKVEQSDFFVRLAKDQKQLRKMLKTFLK